MEIQDKDAGERSKGVLLFIIHSTQRVIQRYLKLISPLPHLLKERGDFGTRRMIGCYSATKVCAKTLGAHCKILE